jgi:hemoglobin
MTNLMNRIALALALVSGSAVAFADGPKPAPAPVKAPAAKSLFDRLGGMPAIKTVIHDFVTNVAADKVINKRFAKTKTPEFEVTLVTQVCEATGGPCKYKGKTMAAAHKGMKITDAEWDSTIADLKAALDKNKVGDQEQKDLLGALGGMKGDIVGK